MVEKRPQGPFVTVRKKAIPLHFQKKYGANFTSSIFNHTINSVLYKKQIKDLSRKNIALALALEKNAIQLTLRDQMLYENSQHIDKILNSRLKLLDLKANLTRAALDVDDILSSLFLPHHGGPIAYSSNAMYGRSTFKKQLSNVVLKPIRELAGENKAKSKAQKSAKCDNGSKKKTTVKMEPSNKKPDSNYSYFAKPQIPPCTINFKNTTENAANPFKTRNIAENIPNKETDFNLNSTKARNGDENVPNKQSDLNILNPNKTAEKVSNKPQDLNVKRKNSVKLPLPDSKPLNKRKSIASAPCSAANDIYQFPKKMEHDLTGMEFRNFMSSRKSLSNTNIQKDNTESENEVKSRNKLSLKDNTESENEGKPRIKLSLKDNAEHENEGKPRNKLSLRESKSRGLSVLNKLKEPVCGDLSPIPKVPTKNLYGAILTKKLKVAYETDVSKTPEKSKNVFDTPFEAKNLFGIPETAENVFKTLENAKNVSKTLEKTKNVSKTLSRQLTFSVPDSDSENGDVEEAQKECKTEFDERCLVFETASLGITQSEKNVKMESEVNQISTTKAEISAKAKESLEQGIRWFSSAKRRTSLHPTNSNRQTEDTKENFCQEKLKTSDAKTTKGDNTTNSSQTESNSQQLLEADFQRVVENQPIVVLHDIGAKKDTDLYSSSLSVSNLSDSSRKTTRPRQNISYREPSLNSKMRRD